MTRFAVRYEPSIGYVYEEYERPMCFDITVAFAKLDAHQKHTCSDVGCELEELPRHANALEVSDEAA